MQTQQNPQQVPLAAIALSPTNPRTTFSQDALSELAASILQQGVLQPVILRPKAGKNGIKFELVVGSRRFKAADIAKLKEIPALVRELSDDEVAEIQVIENVQREDVHPIEEAEGYEKLIAKGMDVKTLASKIGKSESYIAKRLKLGQLGKAGREAYRKGELNISTALLLARIPIPKLQDQALKEIGRLDTSDAIRHVQTNYMMRLVEAPWDKSDEKLVPAAGSCEKCPKRSGSNPDLFPDLKKEDRCTDPVCFAGKMQAHRDQQVKAAEAKGFTVITGAAAKKLMPYSHSRPAGYIQPGDHNYDDPKSRTYKELLGNHDIPAVMIDNPHTGKLLAVYPAKDVARAIAEKHPKLKNEKRKDTAQAQYSAAQKKAKLEREVRGAIYTAVRAKVGDRDLGAADLQILVGSFFNRLWHENQKKVAALWECELKAMDKKITTLDASQLRRLMFDCALIHEVNVSPYATEPMKKIMTFAARVRVDALKIRRDMEKAQKAKRKPKSKGKAKSK